MHIKHKTTIFASILSVNGVSTVKGNNLISFWINHRDKPNAPKLIAI